MSRGFLVYFSEFRRPCPCCVFSAAALSQEHALGFQKVEFQFVELPRRIVFVASVVWWSLGPMSVM